jgi:2Fe-2S ferredoxin
MAHITYDEGDGRSVTLDMADGWSLMHGATANGAEGLTVTLPETQE